ncbi:MAG: ABC transporter substrate-binding protein, partial [Burkholderiales bacterium]
MKKIMNLALASFMGVLSTAHVWAQTQGVSKTEIVLGSILDMSGPLAGPSKQARNGLQMRVNDVNANGGIGGRKVKMIFEDNGYDPKKAMLAAQKLVNSDEVFAILSQQKAFKRVGILYQDDEFGLEILRGAEAGLKMLNMTLVEKTSFKRGATDFSSQIAKLKAANCDLVILGTIIRETVGALGEARKTGFEAAFLGAVPAYNHLIHVLGGKAVEGFYAAHQAAHPYADDSSKAIRDWSARYKTQFAEDPSVWSVWGYSAMDIFQQAAVKAGANLSTESFANAMETTVFARDIFGSPECKMSKTDHLCSNKFRLSQIQNG